MPSLEVSPDDSRATTGASSVPTDVHVVGVAVEVPEPYASQLREHRASFGDTKAESVPTHVTLLPPTSIEADALPAVQQHLGHVARRNRVFGMRLRGTGTFRPVSPVVFVTVARGISECELLADAVCSGPLECEPAFPYHPHVTVAHDVDESELDRAFDTLADYACAFEVEAFSLYVHDGLDGWRTDTVFPLRQD